MSNCHFCFSDLKQATSSASTQEWEDKVHLREGH